MENELVKIFSNIMIVVLLIVPALVILKKAGLSPALSLFLFVPFLGVLIVYLILAFSKWPKTEKAG